MKTETMNLWDTIPGEGTDNPIITAYIPEKKTSDTAIIIFPGGGYKEHSVPREGEDYAEFLAQNGICSFVVKYRLFPNKFPVQLLDARRAVKFVRHFANKYGIDKNKVVVMGSSAGGHLAALCSTYKKDIEIDVKADEIESEDFFPNAQILCFPAILMKSPGYTDMMKELLGDNYSEKMLEELTPALIAEKGTPMAFIWHTFEDDIVNVTDSLEYAKKLKEIGTPVEMHIFPNGGHGLGVAKEDMFGGEYKGILNHVAQWVPLVVNWLKYIGY